MSLLRVAASMPAARGGGAEVSVRRRTGAEVPSGECCAHGVASAAHRTVCAVRQGIQGGSLRQ